MKVLTLIPAAIALTAMMQDRAITMQPGQWEFTTHMTELDLPGVAPDVVASARSALGPPETKTSCVSPEEATNPAARLTGAGDRSNCTFSRTVFADGRIDVAGTCTSRREPQEARPPVEIELRGTFTPTEMSATIDAETANPRMFVRGTMTARRTGDCQPGAS